MTWYTDVDGEEIGFLHLGKVLEIGGDEYSAETVSFSLKDRNDKVEREGREGPGRCTARAGVAVNRARSLSAPLLTACPPLLLFSTTRSST